MYIYVIYICIIIIYIYTYVCIYACTMYLYENVTYKGRSSIPRVVHHCCSVLQCVVVCGSVLRIIVAVCLDLSKGTCMYIHIHIYINIYV